MFRARLQLHQIHHIDDTDFQIRKMLAENRSRRQNLKRRRISATCHDDIRLGFLIVTRPLPNADAFGAMNHGLLDGQPLRQGMLTGYHDVHVAAAPQAVVEDRQKAIGVGGKIDPHNRSLLVDHMIEKARVLMREAVVILLPDMRCQQNIQRRDLTPPGQFVA